MFKVKPHEPKSLIWWYEQRQKINMSPTYQRRGSLWSKQKKALLIDSVLNEYDIPKIYIADFTQADTSLNEARKPYAVIDGQQRLETFFEFFKNRVELPAEFVFLPNPSLSLQNLKYRDLRRKFPTIAQKFEEYTPAVMSVITDEEEKVDVMFVRLNSGLQVNAAERRNAMPGPIPRLIRKLVAHQFFKSSISFNTRRMAEYNAAAKVLLIEYRGKFVDTKAPNLDRFVKENKETHIREFTQAQKTIMSVLDDMTAQFQDKDPLLGTTGPIPLYYWFFKNTSRHKQSIRTFLEDFVPQVKRNLEILREDPDRADPELTSYYTMGRTTNDQASLTGRLEILQRRLQVFLRQRRR